MRPYRRAQEALEASREDAYAAIRDAAASGMSLRAIAETTNMSHQRVAQIVKG
jgi:transposase-like protein